MSIIDDVIRLADAANKIEPIAPGKSAFSTIRPFTMADVIDRVWPLIEAGPTAEEKALHDYVRSLDADCILDLITAMYCGRESCSWRAMRKDVMFNIEPKYQATQMLSKAPLAEYLRKGKRRVPASSRILQDRAPARP